MARFSYVEVASRLQEGRPRSPQWERVRERVSACGGERLGQGHAGEAFAYLVLSGGTEQQLTEMWLARPDPAQPVLLIAHPDDNSLPAALEALAWWRQQGRRGQIAYLPEDGPSDPLDRAVTDHLTWVRLHDTRVGLAGRPSDWLVASRPDPHVVSAIWGPEIVPMSLEPAVAAHSLRGDSGGLAAAMAAGADVIEPTPPAVRQAAAVLPTLEELMEGRDLDAVTVRCFDLIESLGTSGCLALAELNDRGFVAGCEGDVPSTIGMLWVKTLLDATSWMANPARLDVTRNTLLVAHCTIARSMVGSYRLRTHFESGMGAAIAGALPTGAYTLLRIGGDSLDRLWLAEGVATGRSPEEGLCRTQLEVALDSGSVVDLLRAPLGNHVVVLPGRHSERLDAWWQTYVAPL